MSKLPMNIVNLILDMVPKDINFKSPASDLLRVSKYDGTLTKLNGVLNCYNFWIARAHISRNHHKRDLMIHRHAKHYDSVIKQRERSLYLNCYQLTLENSLRIDRLLIVGLLFLIQYE